MSKAPAVHVARTKFLAAFAAVTLLLAGLVGLAAPASADSSVALTAANGTVGVAQTLTATVSSTVIGAPSGVVNFTANGVAIGSQPVGGSLGSTVRISWLPTAAGAVAIQAEFDAADGSQAFDTATVTIGQVGTATSISTPGTAGPSTVVTLGASVRSQRGAYVPTGSVTFLLNTGAVIGVAGLDGNGRATVNYQTPAAAGTVIVYATYSGDANAATSQSAVDSIKISATAPGVSLVVPQTNYVNTAVAITAKITPASATGTVDFSVNGKYLGTDKVKNGAASITWVPNALGTFTLSARYSGGSGVAAGSASNQVQVIQQLKADQITVDPAGSPGIWVPGNTGTLANGTSETLNATSASGAPVALTAAGPCSLNGNVLKINGVGGPCTVTAKTNGGNGFAPASQAYNLQTVAGAQTAKVAAPVSGTYKKGSKLKLSKTTTETNLGQPVKWKVTKGSDKCKVITASGYFKLNLVKKGKCTVKASAPAISNQWNAYSTTRNYTVN